MKSLDDVFYDNKWTMFHGLQDIALGPSEMRWV